MWRASAPARSTRTVYGIDPGSPISGGWFIRNYVHFQFAHLQGDELLLWDDWGAMADTLDGADVSLTDEIAALLIASDTGDETATKKLADRYQRQPGPAPTGRSFITSPTGDGQHTWIDLVRPAV